MMEVVIVTEVVEVVHTVELRAKQTIRGQNRGHFPPRNRGQKEGILSENREQNLFGYVQRFKDPAIPKHSIQSKYTIVKPPSCTI